MSDAVSRRTRPQLSERGALKLVPRKEPQVAWAEYPRIEPGVYSAYCKGAQWYWEPGFKRWTGIVWFEVSRTGLGPSDTIPIWFNGGSGDHPKAGRRSRYFAEWIRAKGGPPERKDRLSPWVFTKRMATVTIGDIKGKGSPYSVVREIMTWDTGKPVNKSHSQVRHG
jgi:hypothetical protein